MQFSEIIGQNEAKQRLVKTAGEGFIPHAQLFCGQEGVGKLALAIAYAQSLNCLYPVNGDSCGTCSSCVKYNKLSHPDLHFVFPIVKKDKKEVCDDYLADWRAFVDENKGYFNLSQWLAYIGTDNAQGLIYARESEEIMRKLSLKIYEAKYKVLIIWLPEKMHEVCANKLLKLIEEPTDKTLILLVSNNPDQILTTIQSRCQRINIPRFPEAEMVQILESKYSLQPQDAASVAHIANGSYLKAIQTISLNEEHTFFFNLFVKMMRSSYARNIKAIKEIANEIAGVGRERQKNYLVYCQRMVREYFVSNLKQNEIIYLNSEEDNFGIRFSAFINERNIIDFSEELALAERHIEQNVNAKMVFFDLCLKVTMLLKR